MAVKLRVRRDTAANWTSADPVLDEGEIGYETDTGAFKIGDGSTAWTSLSEYASPAAARLEEASDTVAASGAAEALDLSAASIFNVTLTDNCTFSFANSPSDGFGFTLILVQDGTGSRTVTWPVSVEWAGGSPPALTGTAGSKDILTFMTDDGGTTWYGFVAGLDVS